MSNNHLNVLGTSIGNIEDMTLRGLRLMFESDVILAEDTRVFSSFKGIIKERYKEVLKTLNIDLDHSQKFLSYREQNHSRVINSIHQLLTKGKVVTQVSDAGMPGISDPGYKLIEEVLKQGFDVDVIPGATSVETALVASGLPTDRYVFLGFLPRTRGKAVKLLKAYSLGLTAILFESPFRVVKTLEMIQEEFGNEVQVAACNDLTKKFQKVFRGDINKVLQELKKAKLKGEWVIVINYTN
jgi:16S rRNA (cytidine1402-2'-O)-methyltransferase